VLRCWIWPRAWLSPARRLECAAQFRALAIRVLSLEHDWRRLRILLPLAGANRNPGGSMFGGAVAALADPIPALSCNRVFPGHAVWTRDMRLDFRREGRTDLELRFVLEPQQEAQIAAELARRGRSTPTFKFGFWDATGRLCVQVENTVAIRPTGYRPPTR
jgi:acyl-coenzyme A thioesterase PaaI-like protein